MLNKLILFGLLCFVWSDPAQFEKFKRNFDRKYSNQSEEMRRYNIFSENLAKITQHNSREGIDCDDDDDDDEKAKSILELYFSFYI